MEAIDAQNKNREEFTVKLLNKVVAIVSEELMAKDEKLKQSQDSLNSFKEKYTEGLEDFS